MLHFMVEEDFWVSRVAKSWISAYRRPVMDPFSSGSQNSFDLAGERPGTSHHHDIDGHRIGDEKIHRVIADGNRSVIANQEVISIQRDLFQGIAIDASSPIGRQDGAALLVYDTGDLPLATQVSNRHLRIQRHETPP